MAGGVEHVLAQEHLMRGVRRVGLVLVDERRSGVERSCMIVRRFVGGRGRIVSEDAVEPRRQNGGAR